MGAPTFVVVDKHGFGSREKAEPIFKPKTKHVYVRLKPEPPNPRIEKLKAEYFERERQKQEEYNRRYTPEGLIRMENLLD